MDTKPFRLSAYTNDELYEGFKKIAEENHVTVSTLLGHIIEEFIKQYNADTHGE
jgi:predicted DNA-binding ribbon-helix-helix protein